MIKEFIECYVEVIEFGRQSIIETSSFDGVVDEFYDENGNPIGQKVE